MLVQFEGAIPSFLIPAARNYFVGKGITPGAVTDSGDIDPQALVGVLFDSIEVRTRYNTFTYDLKNTTSNPVVKKLLKHLQPAILLNSAKLGNTVLAAPYGVPAPVSSAALKVAVIAIAAGSVGSLLLLGAIIGRKLS